VAQVLQAADAPAAAAELDQILPYDPALLCWLLHTAGGPVFAAGPGPLGWSLQQTVERLGAREVGLAAQQIRFYNTAVRAHLGRFDLRRFWAHSAACALVADWLVRVRRLRLPGPVEFSDYWPSALLHDIGRLALGYVFPERLAAIHEGLNGSGVSFRQAERQLGEIGNHEELAGLLALNAGLPGSVVEAIRRHHSPGEQAPPLVCLIHLADHLCKAIGLSCMANEPSGCNPFVLDRVGVPLADLSRMADELRGRDSVTGRVMALVQRFGGKQYSTGAGPTPCGTCGSGG
jgi:HD-like signal output (HDOD) protein